MVKYWVWLSQVFAYGSEIPRNLLSVFKNPKSIYKATDNQLRDLDFITENDIKSIRCTSIKRAEKIIKDCQDKKIRVLCFDDEEYPIRLKNIFGSPMVLYVLGTLRGIDEKVVIGVVGTRNATEYSINTTKRLCDDLVDNNVLLVSGCAVGIDAVAHKSAVDKKTATIAVLGCGLDINYPVENRNLKIQILKNGGAILSEYPPGTSVKGSNFPLRNRIISALSNGVLVGQAPQRSGALITANYALEQGKDVFCIPPRDIYNNAYSGVHNLIRDGAISVFGVQDILFEYVSEYSNVLDLDKILSGFRTNNFKVKTTISRYIKSKKTTTSNKENTKEEKNQQEIVNVDNILENYSQEHKKIFYLLTETPQFMDEIVLQSNLPAITVFNILVQLEMLGLVSSKSGGKYVVNNKK